MSDKKESERSERKNRIQPVTLPYFGVEQDKQKVQNETQTVDKGHIFAGSETLSGKFRKIISIFNLEKLGADVIESTIDGAFNKTPPKQYHTKIITLGIIAALLSFTITIILSGVLTVVETSVSPIIALISGAILAVLLGFSVPVASYFVIRAKLGSRKKEIDEVFPDSIAFMYTLSEGGFNHVEMIKSIANSETIYGELAYEFRSIVREAEMFGIDYTTAIERHARRTPSDDLSRFLVDLISIIKTGSSMTDFLEDQKNVGLKRAEENQDAALDKIEVAAQLYLALSIFPLVMLAVVVLVNILQSIPNTLIYGISYGLIPSISIFFGLIVSIITKDTTQRGMMKDDDRLKKLSEIRHSPNAKVGDKHNVDVDLAELFDDEGDEDSFVPDSSDHIATPGVKKDKKLDVIYDGSDIFKSIKKNKFRKKVRRIGTDPLTYFRENPLKTLYITVPLSAMVMGILFAIGELPQLSFDQFTASPVRSTMVWLYTPIFIITIPAAAFFEWQNKLKINVYKDIPPTLNKISSVNNTGVTLLESVKNAVESDESRLANELEAVYEKTRLGMDMSSGFVDLNNKYDSPELARSLRLIEEAQRATQDVSKVLDTTVEIAEKRITMLSKQRSKTRIQVVFIVIVNLLSVVILLMLDQVFLPTLAGETDALGGLGDAAGGAIDTEGEGTEFIQDGVASMVFLHTITLQSITSGLIAGYVRNGNILTGVKYMIAMLLLVAGLWTIEI